MDANEREWQSAGGANWVSRGDLLQRSTADNVPSAVLRCDDNPFVKWSVGLAVGKQAWRGHEDQAILIAKSICLLSEKRIHISDNRFQMKVANPIDRAMLARIRARGDDWVFTATDFLDCGTRHAVDKALSRMAAAGAIRRAARGLYHVSRPHPIVGTTGPNIDNLARALAGKGGTKLQPTGAYAANLLGLSEQVPAKVVFLTDGRSKHIRLGKLDLVLKQTSPRIMATAGRVSGMVIQALRYLGKAQVTDDTVRRLDHRISDADRKQLLKDVPYAPVWIGNIMRRLATRT